MLMIATQRLLFAVDKISMEATLSNLQRSSQESHNKLDSTIKEIAGLQQQLAELRSKLEEAHKDRGSVEVLTIHTLQNQLHFD